MADPTGIDSEVIDLDVVDLDDTRRDNNGAGVINVTDGEFANHRFDLQWLAEQVKERDAQIQAGCLVVSRLH